MIMMIIGDDGYDNNQGRRDFVNWVATHASSE
jgi:hypothetical protein